MPELEVPKTTAANLEPSAEQAMEFQSETEALLVAQEEPEFMER
jgi:hypothetical protein